MTTITKFSSVLATRYSSGCHILKTNFCLAWQEGVTLRACRKWMYGLPCLKGVFLFSNHARNLSMDLQQLVIEMRATAIANPLTLDTIGKELSKSIAGRAPQRRV